MPSLNFIPPHRRHDRSRRRRLERWAVVCTSYGLMLVAASALLALSPAGAIDRTPERLDVTERRLAETQSRIASIRHQLATAQRNVAVTDTVGRQPNWSGLLLLLAESAGQEVVLTRCEGRPPAGMVTASIQTHSSPDEFMLKLSGIGRSQSAVSRFVLALERSPLFDSATLASTRRESFDSTTVMAFDIECIIAITTEDES